MPEDTLARACEQTEQSDPPVRAAALLRIARVHTAFNGEQARQTFRNALGEAWLLPGHDGEFLLAQARLLAAAVVPDLLNEIPGLP